jgi:hypothetical protein
LGQIRFYRLQHAPVSTIQGMQIRIWPIRISLSFYFFPENFNMYASCGPACFDASLDPDTDLDRHQHGNSDPDRLKTGLIHNTARNQDRSFFFILYKKFVIFPRSGMSHEEEQLIPNLYRYVLLKALDPTFQISNTAQNIRNVCFPYYCIFA